MNQKIWILFKNDLANSIPFHQLFRSAKQGNGVKITFAALLLMGIFLLIYNTLTAKTLVSLGQTALIPAYMLSVSSIMMIFLSLLRANGTIFGSSDFEQLSTYPVSEKEIFISKLLHLYFFHLLVSLLFTIPVLLVWAPDDAASPLLILLFFYYSTDYTCYSHLYWGNFWKSCLSPGCLFSTDEADCRFFLSYSFRYVQLFYYHAI